jgi:hypothetical protein
MQPLTVETIKPGTPDPATPLDEVKTNFTAKNRTSKQQQKRKML